MTARNARRIEQYLGIWIASEYMLAFAQRGATARPDQSANDVAGLIPCEIHGIRMERIAESMNRPDISGPPRIVMERAADLSDQVGQVRLDDERVRPKAIVQLRFGQRLWPILDQDLEQLKGFRREGSPCLPE